MADEGTSSTLVLVAAVLQLIFFFILAGITGIMASTLVVLPTIPPSYLPPEFPPLDQLMAMMVGVTALVAIMTVVAFIFTILWLSWRSTPSQHKVGLILTGILALILSGILPGILVLIAGAIAPSEPTTVPAPARAPEAKKTPPKSTEGVKYCSACGTPVADPNAQFCGVCGASIT